MLRSATEYYLLVLLGIFTIPYLIWRFCKTDGYAPLVVVQIIAGVALGPGVFGYLFPNAYTSIFSPDVITMMAGVATWAVVLFVSTAGLEIDTHISKSEFKETVSTALFALFTPLIISLPIGHLLSRGDRWMGENASEWQFVLSIGMAMSVTALPILVLLLDKMNILKSDMGIRALRYASFDDIAIWTVFAIILLDWGRVTRQVAFFIFYVAAFVLIRKLFVKLKQEDRFPAFLIWIIVCALGADWSGLHYLVGGFLAGLAIDEKLIGHEVAANFRKYVLLLVMPVFFLNTGLKTDWEINNPTIIIIAIGLFAIQAFGKILGIKFASIFNKWDGRDAITIGWLLQTKALIEIIFCTIMLDKGIITGQMFTALLFMAIISTTVTTPIVSRRLATAAIQKHFI